MKVKEYLVKRIQDLEHDLKVSQDMYAGALSNAQMLREESKDLNELLDQCDMEKEHIKQIITCNIELRKCSDEADRIDLDSNDDDFKTLLSILNIKPEDYDNKEVIPDAETTD